MNGETRLHLGCGTTYKPGYVNIDMYDNRLADVVGDAERLPLRSRSAARIEAYHVLEHFDLVSCIYVLSEWYGVLRNGGSLIIETPDLQATMKKLAASDTEMQSRTLQWMFGIDSPGMAHKTAFSFDLISNLLEECGFGEVRKCKPETHLYEPGLRIECAKPGNVDERAEFASAFRFNLRRELSEFDSFIMLPLERHLKRILGSLPPSGRLDRDGMIAMLSQAAVVNPRIAIAALDTIKVTHSADTAYFDSMQSTLQRLREEDMHMKALTLWLQGTRGVPVEEEFKRFTTTLEKDVAAELTYGEGHLSYLLDLTPHDIPILDLDLLLLEARTWFQLGIKEFSQGNLEKATRWLEQSARANPGNPLVFWNLARLKLADGDRVNEAIVDYDRAVELSPEPDLRRRILKEAKSVQTGGAPSVQHSPISE